MLLYISIRIEFYNGVRFPCHSTAFLPHLTDIGDDHVFVYILFLADRTATHYYLLLASSCRTGMYVCLSVTLCIVSLRVGKNESKNLFLKRRRPHMHLFIAHYLLLET